MSKLRHCNTMDPMVRQAEVTPQLLRHLYVYRPSIMRRNVICLYDLHHPSNFFLPISQPSAGNPSTQPSIRRLALPLIRSIIQPNGHPSPPSIDCKVAVDVIADYAKGFHISFLLKHQKLYPTWQQPQFFLNIFRLQFLKPCVYVPSLIHLKRICTNR